MTDKERIKELERTVEELRVIIADQSATNQNDWVEYQYKLRDNTNEICNKIKKYDINTNKQTTSYTDYVIGIVKLLDQINKEGEEKCVKTIQTTK